MALMAFELSLGFLPARLVFTALGLIGSESRQSHCKFPGA